MPEALILPPTSPDQPGLVVIDQELNLVQEFGVLATCLIEDPIDEKKDILGHIIHRMAESADDPSVTLETRIERKRVPIKRLHKGKSEEIREKNKEYAEQMTKEMNAKFRNDIQNDPTLIEVDYEAIILRVIQPHGEMSCQINKRHLGEMDLDDPFFQCLLGYFRSHIEARNC